MFNNLPQSKGLRLGFHYHIPALIKNGKICTMSLQGLFIDSLAVNCEKIILFLHTPLQREMELMDYEITSPNVELVGMGIHNKIPQRLVASLITMGRVKKRLSDIDILLIRCPSPLLPALSKTVKDTIGYSYLLVGEIALHVQSINQPSWRKKLIGIYARWNESLQRKYAKGALVFSNNQPLFDEYKKLSANTYLVRTTTLKKSDFFIREDTCLSPPYKILYTGRIDKTKGILEIIEAIGILNNEGISCILDIVGWATAGDDTSEQISKLTLALGLSDKIIFHGKKKAGEELFGFYKNADIFINASQVSEGFPRTITEALGNSVPVISTEVGSIGHFHKHKHDIMLVETHNAADIAEKAKEIINNPELRKKLIKNGLESVQEVTLEFQAKKITDIIKNYLEQKIN